MINISEECWQTVIRTAFSLIIGEAQDFACEILDAGGRQIVHSPRAMPVFNLTLPIAVNAMIERYPPETLEPGDVLVTNDPWLCAGHLFDIAVAVPVFRAGRWWRSAGWSVTSPTSAAPRTASTPARSTRKASRSRP